MNSEKSTEAQKYVNGMLPCPFCGSNQVEYEKYNFQEGMYQDSSEGACRCQDCGAMGGSVLIIHKYCGGVAEVNPSDECEAIRLWNKRTGE